MGDAGSRIELVGELNSKNVSEVEKQLHENLSKHEHLIIDLNKLENIDVSGIFMLFMFKQNAQKSNKNVSYLLDSAKVITGNTFNLDIPELFKASSEQNVE